MLNNWHSTAYDIQSLNLSCRCEILTLDPWAEIPFKIRNNLERQGYDIFYFDMGNNGWSWHWIEF